MSDVRNHGMNAMHFRLFREQRPQNFFCQRLFGMDCCFCFSSKVMYKDTFVFPAKECNLILLFFFYNVNICNTDIDR